MVFCLSTCISSLRFKIQWVIFCCLNVAFQCPLTFTAQPVAAVPAGHTSSREPSVISAIPTVFLVYPEHPNHSCRDTCGPYRSGSSCSGYSPCSSTVSRMFFTTCCYSSQNHLGWITCHARSFQFLACLRLAVIWPQQYACKGTCIFTYICVAVCKMHNFGR